MNGSGKAGNGRGSNRRRPFRRWDKEKENNAWQDGEFYIKGSSTDQKSDVSQGSDNSNRNRSFNKGPGGAHEKRVHGRGQNSENQGRQNRGGSSKKGGENTRGGKVPFVERPKWVPPVLNTEPLPVPTCPWCGKPIRDLSSAIADKDTGVPLHFDCVAAKIAESENLEKGDMITYIGGGRFGVVCFANRDSQDRASDRSFPQEFRDFKIKKIIEWENKDKRAEWRSTISDHYSAT